MALCYFSLFKNWRVLHFFRIIVKWPRAKRGERVNLSIFPSFLMCRFKVLTEGFATQHWQTQGMVRANIKWMEECETAREHWVLLHLAAWSYSSCAMRFIFSLHQQGRPSSGDIEIWIYSVSISISPHIYHRASTTSWYSTLLRMLYLLQGITNLYVVVCLFLSAQQSYHSFDSQKVNTG